jgi:hypothetical protein
LFSLDLEYYREANPELNDPVDLVNKFLQIVIEVFAQLFSIELHPERSFLILDSSTSKKFSAHVIGLICQIKQNIYILIKFILVHLPNGQLFPTNVSLKPLVSAICRFF